MFPNRIHSHAVKHGPGGSSESEIRRKTLREKLSFCSSRWICVLKFFSR